MSTPVIVYVKKVEVEIYTFPLTIGKVIGGCLMSYGIHNPTKLSVLGACFGTLLVTGMIAVEKIFKRFFGNKFTIFLIGKTTRREITEFSRKDSSTPCSITDSITYDSIENGDCYLRCKHDTPHYVSIDTAHNVNKIFLKQQGLTDERLAEMMSAEAMLKVDCGKVFVSSDIDFQDKDEIFYNDSHLRDIESETKESLKSVSVFVKNITASHCANCSFCMKPMSKSLVK